MTKLITSEDLLQLFIEETNNKFSELDEAALQRITARINYEYIEKVHPDYQHVERGTYYEKLGEGQLQNASNHVFVEGDILVAYYGEDKKLWFRYEPEFKDGRFKQLKELSSDYSIC